MEKLTDLELFLLNGLTTKHPSLEQHIQYLKVVNRKMSGNGMCVNLAYESGDGQLTFEDINALFSNGENIEIKNLSKGLGYVIDVSDGQITAIEFLTYGEKWDGKFTDVKVVMKEHHEDE